MMLKRVIVVNVLDNADPGGNKDERKQQYVNNFDKI